MARPRTFDARIRLNVTDEQRDLMRRLRALTGMGQSAVYREALRHYAASVLPPQTTTKPTEKRNSA